MKNKNILVAEDDKIISMYVCGILKDEGFIVESAFDGLSAVKMFESGDFDLVITDLEMPEMDGTELIERLKSKEYPPVIIVSTVKNDPETIISIMKKGVYTYLPKPINAAELIFSVNKGLEYSKVLHANIIFEKEKNIRLENQLEWYRWRERFLSDGKAGSGSTIFQGLLTSFSQGAGFGSMVSMLNILASNAVRENDYYKIDANFFDAIVENNKISEKAITVLGVIRDLIENGLELKEGSCSNLHDIFIDSVNEAENYAKMKNQRILISETKNSFENNRLKFNHESMRKVAQEILINALKYSEKNSEIIVLCDIEDSNFRVSVINSPEINNYSETGIPVEYENMIFEPFCRLVKTVQEDYHTLEFGLGLTMAEKTIKAHKGKIRLYNIKDYSFIKDHTSKVSEIKVCAVISIPLLTAS